jgi:hypothetical protein
MKDAKPKVLPLNVKAIKAAIKTAAAEAEGKPREFRVKGSRNLVLIVQPSGKASWYCFYFIRQGTKRRLRKWWIGTHEHTPLADARQAAGEVMRKVEAGGDPVGEAEARRGALTLRELFKQRHELDQDTAARTLDDYSKALELDVYSRIGDVPCVELTSDQIADVLERIERRSRHSAHRARCAISSTFRWAQRKGKLRRNPVVGLGFTVRPIPRDRVFTDAECASCGTASKAHRSCPRQCASSSSWRSSRACARARLPARASPNCCSTAHRRGGRSSGPAVSPA